MTPQLLFFSATFINNSLKISLVVGTILNLINQTEAIFGPAAISWTHAGLNYCVPFCVAYYSALKNCEQIDRREHV